MAFQEGFTRQVYQPECILIEKLYDWVYKPFSTTVEFRTLLDIEDPGGADLVPT